jgi:phosphoglycolate phosphatase
MMAKNSPSIIFFDLDGTLSDSREGITKCLCYALEQIGREPPSRAELEKFIGPPLRKIFPDLLSDAGLDLVEKCVSLYRERYGAVGIYESVLYPDIRELLSSLRQMSFRLFVVTSKSQIYAERVIAHFSLTNYFEAVYGPACDGRFDDKRELVAYVLQELGVRPAEVVMVGDRRDDIAAAVVNGCSAVGITYGFGSVEELTTAGASALVHSPLELVKLLERLESN